MKYRCVQGARPVSLSNLKVSNMMLEGKESVCVLGDSVFTSYTGAHTHTHTHTGIHTHTGSDRNHVQ